MTNYSVIKYACYMSNASMSAVATISPLLFVTFHELYGISYALLGLLVLINFCTQLFIDLIFSFYSQKFNIQKTVRLMPLLTFLGLVIYSIMPAILPNMTYFFIVIGTVIFSVSAGLAEVLISPVIAAIPSDNPERDMSRAHSVYAWGAAVVILISTLFIRIFGRESWHILAMMWSTLPLAAFILFMRSEIPALNTENKGGPASRAFKNPLLLLCVACIFFGGAAENTMTQWCSGYLETALQIPKVLGDVLGTAVFAVMLGTGRTLYAKFGKNISKCLIFGFLGSFFCYITAALSQSPFVGLAACAFTGICVSMLWPGTLIYTAEIVPETGVAAYALLAAGGDLGGSVAPQLVGSITDAVAQNGLFSDLFSQSAYSPEQIGFKVGMLAAAIFPLAGVGVILIIRAAIRRRKMQSTEIKEDDKFSDIIKS